MPVDLPALLRQVCDALPHLPGWCSEAKAAALVHAVLFSRPSLCVEIGVFGGRSLVPQALALRALGKGRIIGIDPWETGAALESMVADKNKIWWSSVSLRDIREGCERAVERLELRPHVELVAARSEDVVDRLFLDSSIDVLHIDGNHSEEKSTRDVSLLLPKLRPGALVFFDDVSWEEDGQTTTRRAYELLCRIADPIAMVDDCAILRVPVRA
jgi:predicted O-methyltransferase YrrM